jgi:hypothetical protein
MTSELIQVLKILEENNIEAISFKGPVLSQLAYGDVVSRQYCDLDILVKEEDLFKVDLILKNEKYSLRNKIYNDDLKIETLKDSSYFKDNLNLEIHWKLFSFNLKKNSFETKYCVDFNNIKVNSFDINFYIVYLSIHGSRHLWERIEWIVDINNLICKYNEQINFDKIYQIADEFFDNRKSVDLGLYLCYELFNNLHIKNKFDKSVLLLAKESLNVIINKEELTKYKIFLFHNNLYTKNSSRIKHLLYIFKINERDLNFIDSNYRIVYYLFKPIRLITEIFK